MVHTPFNQSTIGKKTHLKIGCIIMRNWMHIFQLNFQHFLKELQFGRLDWDKNEKGRNRWKIEVIIQSIRIVWWCICKIKVIFMANHPTKPEISSHTIGCHFWVCCVCILRNQKSHNSARECVLFINISFYFEFSFFFVFSKRGK